MRKTYRLKAKLSKTTEQNAIQWLGLCQKLYNLAQPGEIKGVSLAAAILRY